MDPLSLPQPILDVTLNSGRLICAKTLHISHTYEGLLEGMPSDELNQEHLSGLPKKLTSIFGNWPTHIVPPEVKREPPLPNQRWAPAFMPEFELAAFFLCYDPINPEMHASGLVIAWHEWSYIPFMSPKTRTRVEQIRWEDYAKDFEW